MLDLEIGDAVDIAGHACIRTEAGKNGHAIYGPYEHLEPGSYVVAFRLAGEDPASAASSAASPAPP